MSQSGYVEIDWQSTNVYAIENVIKIDVGVIGFTFHQYAGF